MKFKEVVHLYIGCRMKRVDQFANVEKIQTLQSIDIDHKYNVSNGKSHWFPVQDSYKPILRRLEDMNAIEMMEFVNLIPFYERSHTFDFENKYGAIHFRLSYHGQFNSYKKRVEYTSSNPEQFVYLLSKHLDLFGLIDSGEAIDAATLNPNPYA